ncbi:MAG: ribosome maturation factor RimP [Actinobacteria bacterium 13_1_20CM_3_71_11]|nr:MAG: ribosome maturation factor RimP [Actinobacteria bacterium 13_1_20CM_3_71_11]
MVRRDRAAGRAPGAGRRASTRPARTSPAGGADLAAHKSRLREVIAPIVEAAGYDLEELSVSRAGRRHVLRIMVDGDHGVSLDAVADLSREISAALDAAEETGGQFSEREYVLEVGSPGVDRPLTLPRHWRRNVGRLVAVTAAERQLTGRLIEADDQGIVLDVNGARHEFRHADLGPGRVQVEFGHVDELPDELEEDEE